MMPMTSRVTLSLVALADAPDMPQLCDDSSKVMFVLEGIETMMKRADDSKSVESTHDALSSVLGRIFDDMLAHRVGSIEVVTVDLSEAILANEEDGRLVWEIEKAVSVTTPVKITDELVHSILEAIERTNRNNITRSRVEWFLGNNRGRYLLATFD